MKRIGVGFLYAIVGYGIAAVVGYFLIDSFSSNTHDRSVEAAMTSAFVFGPLGALVAFAVGYLRKGRNPNQSGNQGF